jgi:TetR/AcrR family transcriptional regulator, transcriptional repressor for nem operon
MERRGDTAERLLETAGALVQTRGFNAVSFGDLAERIGIKTASIHHHFPTKEDLGVALVEGYRTAMGEARANIQQERADVPGRLRAYAELFAGTLKSGNRMCLGGMLAADLETLPPRLQRQVRAFITDETTWMASLLDAGRRAGALKFEGDATSCAQALFASLEGAMLIARTGGGAQAFRPMAERLIASLTT